MRTTVTLDPDVERLLKNDAHKRGASFKVALNEAVRKAFLSKPTPAGKKKRFVVKSRSLGLRPGIDLTHANRLVDEMEIEAFLEKNRRVGKAAS